MSEKKSAPSGVPKVPEVSDVPEVSEVPEDPETPEEPKDSGEFKKPEEVVGEGAIPTLILRAAFCCSRYDMRDLKTALSSRSNEDVLLLAVNVDESPP